LAAKPLSRTQRPRRAQRLVSQKASRPSRPLRSRPWYRSSRRTDGCEEIVALESEAIDALEQIRRARGEAGSPRPPEPDVGDCRTGRRRDTCRRRDGEPAVEAVRLPEA